MIQHWVRFYKEVVPFALYRPVALFICFYIRFSYYRNCISTPHWRIKNFHKEEEKKFSLKYFLLNKVQHTV